MQRFGDQRTRMSYLPDLDDYEKSFFDDEDDDDLGPEKEIQGWDVFKWFPLKLKTGSKANTGFFDCLARVSRIVTYFVLFFLILGGAILAKGSLIFAVSQMKKKGSVSYCDYNEMEGRPTGRVLSASVPAEYSIGWYWCIVMAFTCPEILGVIKAMYHCFFKKQTKPRTIDIFCFLIVESLHTVGLALLFLLVLPELNIVQAVVVSSCTCLIPGLLAPFSRNTRQYLPANSYAMIAGDVAAFAGQFCGIIVWIFTGNDLKTLRLKWVLPIAMMLTSCRWWGNYVSAYSGFGWIRRLSRMKERLEACRGITEGCSAVWRILVFSVSTVLIVQSKGIELSRFFDKSIITGEYNVTLLDVSGQSTLGINSPLSINIPPDETPAGFFTIKSYYLPLVVLIVHAAASFVTYSSAKFAYRTLMQGYGFALPITLVVPGTIGTLMTICALRNIDTCMFHKFLPDYLFFDVPADITNVTSFIRHWYVWIWLVTLLSQGWITMHIWTRHPERLAATARIFAVPTYDSLIIDQSIVLNRRIDEIPGGVPRAERLQDLDEVATEASCSNRSSKSGGSTDLELNDNVTRIFVCATMWHETEAEMSEFVGSILRLDMDQGTKRFTQGYYNVRMQDYYELETHVYFDDAFRCMHGCEGVCKHDENETQVNDYVMALIETVHRSVERLHILPKPPKKYPTPYGGRLEWSLPGKTKMVVHLKDKNKIRHRKRWSQVMYMYYLLGYHLMDTSISKERKETIAENTYLLTLDGDIDFRPLAVKILVDLMKRDSELGAACGRIHPIGTGPMVWFQKFEYAIGHWLQKSTEHTIGSVLCSPGAFSLFRAKALMQNNVMRKYATQSTQPMHYVQYDQGEDRWLCTLILQVGYRVEYSAASDSYTHAPETFNEFYNQRRRWIPSTIANIFDLLNSAGETRKVNDDISWPYVIYQWVLMFSTVLGPGTIFLMLVGAFVAAFRIDNWSSFGYNLIPVAIFVAVCFFCEARIQLIVAGIISAFYGLVMVVVLVGIMIQIAEDGWVAPSTILFFVVAAQLVIAGLLHPQEWSCLLCGLIYYVTVPSMYMLLIIFALFNVNNVTWGTRDSKSPAAETAKAEETDRPRKEKSMSGRKIANKNSTDRGTVEFSLAGLFKCILCTQQGQSEADKKLEIISESLDRIASRLNALEKNSDGMENNRRGEAFFTKKNGDSCSKNMGSEREESEENTDPYDDENDGAAITENESEIYGYGSTRGSGNFLVSPYWLQDERLRKGGVEFLSREEETFWEGLIEKYLHPIDADKKTLEKTAEGLKSLRDEYVFKFFMLNALFVLIVFLMQLNKDTLYLVWPLGETYNISYSAPNAAVHIGKGYLELEPIGFLFIIAFVLILSIQFIAMLFHRFITFSHILANTRVEWSCFKKPTDPIDEEDLDKRADDIADGLQKVVENNAESSLARKASTIAPGKRKTVQELAESEDRRPNLPGSIDTLFCRNLKDRQSAMSRFMSTRLPPNLLEAFERRRSTMVTDRRQSRSSNSCHDDFRPNSSNASIKRNPSSISRENSYSYDNRAFITDDYEGESSANEVIRPYRPGRVTFGSVDN